MSGIITILLIIILSPVILFVGFILLFAILGLIALIIMAIVTLICWIIDIFEKWRNCHEQNTRDIRSKKKK